MTLRLVANSFKEVIQDRTRIVGLNVMKKFYDL